MGLRRCTAQGGRGLPDRLRKARGQAGRFPARVLQGRRDFAQGLLDGRQLRLDLVERLLRGVGGGQRRVHLRAHAVERAAHLLDGLRRLRHLAGDGAAGLVGVGLHLAGEAFQHVRGRLGHGGGEGVVDLVVDRVRARVRHLDGHGVHFLVDVVVDARPFVVRGEQAGEGGAEVGGDDDGGVVVARLHAAQRLAFGHELPSQLVIVLEFVHHLGAHVQVPRHVALRPLVLVRHGHADAGGVLVRVPVGGDAVPRVQRRQHERADEDDEGHGVARQAAHVAGEEGEDGLHVQAFLVEGRRRRIIGKTRPRRRRGAGRHAADGAGGHATGGMWRPAPRTAAQPARYRPPACSAFSRR